MAIADIYQKATLVQIPSGYKAADAKLYSVLPNTADGDFTVSADADATRVNKDGLIESTSANQARLNYNFIDGVVQPDPHLLLEPTRVNFIQYSELFSNSYWTKENVTVGTGVLSPDGGSNAQNLIEDTTTGRHRVRASLSVSSGTTYSLSVWAKSSNRNLVINADVLINARSGFDLINGTVQNTTSGTATIKEFPNGWYLCTVIGTATTTQTTVSYLQAQIGTTDVNYTGDGTSTLSLFGAQLEQSSTYASSYIPTSGSAVTRTQDTCNIANFANLPTDYPLTVYWKGQVKEFNGFNCAFSIYKDGASGEFLVVSFNTSSQILVRRAIGGSEDVDFISYSYSLGDVLKIGIKFTSATTFKLFIDGLEIYEETSGVSKTWDFNSVLIGQLRVAADTGNRNPCDALMLFNEALSDAELIALTS